MRVPVLVIGKLTAWRCLAHLLGTDLSPGLGESRRKLECRECRTGIPTSSDHDGIEGLIGNRVLVGKTTLVLDRTFDEHLDAMIADGLELDDTRARYEGRVDLEEGVFGRCANENDDTVFDGME